MEQENLTTLLQRVRRWEPAARDTPARKDRNRVYRRCQKMLNREKAAWDYAPTRTSGERRHHPRP